MGVSQCQLSWEAVSATAYTLETRWLYVDDKGDIQSTWEALDNTEITQQGNRMVAKLSKLSPEFPYTVRAAAIGPTGSIMERTGEANFITLAKPPLITPMRFLLGCLALLLAIAARRWWNDRE